MLKLFALRYAAVLLILLALTPSLAIAAPSIIPTIVPTTCNEKGGCKSVCDIATVAQNVLNAGIYIAVFLSAMLFAYAGFLYLTSVGNPSGVTSAKNIFINVAIGLVIILAGWIVVDTLMKTMTGASFGPWNKVC